MLSCMSRACACAAENRVAIAAAEAIEPLVEMLRVPTDDVRLRAAGALWMLARGNGARTTV